MNKFAEVLILQCYHEYTMQWMRERTISVKSRYRFDCEIY